MTAPKKPRKTTAKTKPPVSTNAPPFPTEAQDAGITSTDTTLTGTTEDSTTQPSQQDDGKNRGDVASAVAEAAANYGASSLESLPLARARDGETRSQCWERLRREGRSAGMTRRGAIAYAGVEIDRLFPPPEPVMVEELPVEPPELSPIPENPEKTGVSDSELSPIGDKIDEPAPAPAATPSVSADSGVPGLSNFPPEWPPLPANAQLQAEIAWVTANRLLVRDGSGVNLSRAMSPPPSYSALSWLETSILFPAKFADISVKATADQDDEKEHIRREKLAIEEIRGILKEMLEAKD